MKNFHGHKSEVHEVSVATLARNWWAVALRGATLGSYMLASPVHRSLVGHVHRGAALGEDEGTPRPAVPSHRS